MRTPSKNILLISPDPWSPYWVSKHHYAWQLAQEGHCVYFLDPPKDKNLIRQINPQLYLIQYRKRFKGLKYLPRTLAMYFMRRELKHISRIARTTFDVVWSFDTSRFFHMEVFSSMAIKIAHLVDLTENFNRSALCKGADLCLGTSEAICRQMKKHHPLTFKISHAYQTVQRGYKPQSKTLLPVRMQFKHSVGYVGNLDIPYLHWRLIRNCIKTYTDTSFFFIGPYGKTSRSRDQIYELQSAHNVFFLGARPSSAIPTYLSCFDVLLVAYQSGKYPQQLASPHKLLEYFASGKVIVSTWCNEYQDKRHLLEMVEEDEDIIARLGEVLANLDEYNDADRVHARKAYAAEHTYAGQLKHIEGLVNQYVSK